MVGRSWYVSFESLISHKNANGGNAKSRAKKSGAYISPNFVEKPQGESQENVLVQETYREVPLKTFKPEVSRQETQVSINAISLVSHKDQTLAPSENLIASPYVSQTHSHHSAFEKKFPKIVAGMVAFLFAVSVFQFSITLNKDTELAYQKLGNVIENSFSDIFPKENMFSANVNAGTQSGFDQFAISFYKGVHGILFDTRETIVVLFGGEVREEEKPVQHLAQAPQNVTDGQGMVVVPVEVKTDQDAVIAKIKDSFSDEVNVLPKEDGVSGVITPVFRKAANDDYLYVLVPIKN